MLNKQESLELAKPALICKINLIEDWLKNDKLECSEELGDFASQYNTDIALYLYLRANAAKKVIRVNPVVLT